MTSSHRSVAAFAALALTTVASIASAQTAYIFTQAGENVVARGQLVQNLSIPGAVQTTCNIDVHGHVAHDGYSIIFTDYAGFQVPGDPGNLACDDAVTLPIVVTASSAVQINLDRFIVGTRAGPCDEMNYKLPYREGAATFSGDPFGLAGLCSVYGRLDLMTTFGGAAVHIAPMP